MVVRRRRRRRVISRRGRGPRRSPSSLVGLQLLRLRLRSCQGERRGLAVEREPSRARRVDHSPAPLASHAAVPPPAEQRGQEREERAAGCHRRRRVVGAAVLADALPFLAGTNSFDAAVGRRLGDDVHVRGLEADAAESLRGKRPKVRLLELEERVRRRRVERGEGLSEGQGGRGGRAGRGGAGAAEACCGVETGGAAGVLLGGRGKRGKVE